MRNGIGKKKTGRGCGNATLTGLLCLENKLKTVNSSSIECSNIRTFRLALSLLGVEYFSICLLLKIVNYTIQLESHSCL